MTMIEPASSTDGLTVEQWRDRLLERYMAELPERLRMTALYEARHAPVVQMTKYRAAYETLIHASRTPVARLVVDVCAERLNVQGFRIDASNDTDRVLWDEGFRRNRMDAQQADVHRNAVKVGVAYTSTSVWPDQKGVPRIVAESPLECVHESDPTDPFRTLAGLKVWDDTIAGVWRCLLFLDDGVYEWVAPHGEPNIEQQTNGKMPLTPETNPRGAAWTAVRKYEQPFSEPALVPFVTRRDHLGNGRSDLADLVPLFNRLELLTTDLMVASSFNSFAQRWMTGVEIPTDPETGEPIDTFRMAIDRLWAVDDPEASIGQLPATDLRPIIAACSSAVAEIAAVARIPVTYLIQSELANPPSAQALEAMEVGLTHKVAERQTYYGESWETVVSQCSAIMGERIEPWRVHTVWKDARTRSEAQVLDAAVKMLSVGVPTEAVWEFIGAEPDQIARWRRLRAVDVIGQILNGAAQPQRPGQPAQQADNDEDAAE